MLPRRAAFQSLLVLTWVQNPAKKNYRLGSGTNPPFKTVFLVAHPGGGSRHGVTVFFGGVPLRCEGLIQGDDLKSRTREGVIDRLVDLWIGTAQIESADFDLFSERFLRYGCGIPGGKTSLQEMHALGDMGDVSPHRTHRIPMF